MARTTLLQHDLPGFSSDGGRDCVSCREIAKIALSVTLISNQRVATKTRACDIRLD